MKSAMQKDSMLLVGQSVHLEKFSIPVNPFVFSPKKTNLI